MDTRTLATRAIALRVLADLVAEEQAAVRAALEGDLRPGDRVQAEVYVEEGPSDVGMVYRSKPKGIPAEAVVSDPAAFLAWASRVAPEEVVERREVISSPALIEWLEEHYPSAVQRTLYANPPWLKTLLEQVVKDGYFHHDPGTGEVVEGPPPGVSVRPAAPGRSTVTVKPDGAARDVVLDALRSGALRPAEVVPALEAGS